jgi:ketosteroid isomerase-like protein
MRTLFIAVAAVVAIGIGALVGALAASGGSSASSASEEQMRRNADLWEIHQLEKKFHRSTTTHDIDLMMSVYAPNATLVSAGATSVGKRQIRDYWLHTSKSFKNDWISSTAAYKVKITVFGDRGTLFFECHYLDAKTDKVTLVTAADVDVARIDGRWLVTHVSGASATLRP